MRNSVSRLGEISSMVALATIGLLVFLACNGSPAEPQQSAASQPVTTASTKRETVTTAPPTRAQSAETPPAPVEPRETPTVPPVVPTLEPTSPPAEPTPTAAATPEPTQAEPTPTRTLPVADTSPRDVSGMSPIPSVAGVGAGPSASDWDQDAATVEMLLEEGTFFAGVDSTHIALRGIPVPGSIRCDWVCIAFSPGAREGHATGPERHTGGYGTAHAHPTVRTPDTGR